jgi:DAK2 domain fusion protein YloV
MDLKDKEMASSDTSIMTQISKIDGQIFIKLIIAGLNWLKTHQQTVNSLNVFPVPDGDTGTNMVLTMQAALEEVANSDEKNFGKVVHAIAHGALMGARGNSGVILSQIWRGFARAVDNLEEVDVLAFINAFASARDTAYKGVVRPVEGTILTVTKDIALAAEKEYSPTTDLTALFEEIVKAADESVRKTPDLLPVLKEAGVVDAGGKGLFFIFEGMLRYLKGQSLESPEIAVQPLSVMTLENTMKSVEPGQDVEVVIDFYPHEELNLQVFYQNLEKMGTSIQLGEGDGLYRLHIHVPFEKWTEPQTYIHSMAVWSKAAYENLVAQMEQSKPDQSSKTENVASLEPGQIAVVAISPGNGISRIFKSLGASTIVEGGQTMNPSTQEILNSFENFPTDKIIILPNNKNIIGTAQSATELTVKKVAVIPSRSVPQGIAALMRLVPFGKFDEVVAEMQSALQEVQTGEITQATRSVEIDNVSIQQGEYIGLLNGKLVFSSPNFIDTCVGLLSKANAEKYELLTLFSGQSLSSQDTATMVSKIHEQYPNLEIDKHVGNQPHYQLIMSIE